MWNLQIHVSWTSLTSMSSAYKCWCHFNNTVFTEFHKTICSKNPREQPNKVCSLHSKKMLLSIENQRRVMFSLSEQTIQERNIGPEELMNRNAVYWCCMILAFSPEIPVLFLWYGSRLNAKITCQIEIPGSDSLLFTTGKITQLQHHKNNVAIPNTQNIFLISLALQLHGFLCNIFSWMSSRSCCKCILFQTLLFHSGWPVSTGAGKLSVNCRFHPTSDTFSGAESGINTDIFTPASRCFKLNLLRVLNTTECYAVL